MNKTLYLAIALMCAHLNFYPVHAQQHIWGITQNSSGGSVYHVLRNGNEFTKTFATGSEYPGGKDPDLIIQGSDGNLYGISREGSADGAESGVIFRINGSGLTRLANLPPGTAHNASLAQGADGYLYGIGGSQTPGLNTLFRLRSNGKNFQSIQISSTQSIEGASLFAASNGSVYGISETGGISNGGFIFIIKSDFSGIKPIYNFQERSGQRPKGKLTEGPGGYLYGITNVGGIHNKGAIFRIQHDGTQFRVLHHFNQALGSYPSGGLIFSNGFLYGMTKKGGRFNKGIVFKINASGSSFKVLHIFNGSKGEFPASELASDGENNLYGIAGGGLNGNGILFSIKTDGTNFHKLKDFQGEIPRGNLLIPREAFTPNMILVSPANAAITAPVIWTYKSREWASALQYTLQLSESSDFSNPLIIKTSSNEFPVSGLKFSTTYYARVKTSLWPMFGSVTSFRTRSAEDYAFVSRPAHGAVDQPVGNCRVSATAVPGALRYKIELSTNSDFSGKVITDSSSVDGQRVFIFNGLKYGSTYYVHVKSDIASGYGKVTSFTTVSQPAESISYPENGEINLDFNAMRVVVAPGGIGDHSLLLSTTPDFSSNNITRTAIRSDQNEFVLKNLLPSTTYYVKAKSGAADYGQVSSFTTRGAVTSKRLWGMTARGGDHDFGTIFSFSVDSLTLTKHHDYNHEAGYMYLKGDLIQTPSGFAALSMADGTGGGEIFSITRDNGFQLLQSYGPHDGSIMLASDNYVYAVDDWINEFRGGIFRIHSGGDNIGTLERIIFRFQNDDEGINPSAQLLELPDGYFYGTGPLGGSGGNGTIYRLKADGSGFEVLHAFNGADGSYPNSDLIQGEDGYLYGTTVNGGSSGSGVLFRLLPTGGGFAAIFNFSSSAGANPKASLLWHNDRLFGTASSGGLSSGGVVFAINPDGSSYHRLKDCTDDSGTFPLGGLTPGSDGFLYGMTSQGGTHNMGAIFKISPDGSSYTPLYSFSALSGGSPNGKLLEIDDYTNLPGEQIYSESVTTAAPAGFSYFPNPFYTSFNVEFPGQGDESVRYVITDFSGAVVEARTGSTNTTLKMGDQLPKGLYILKVIRGSNTSTYRLVKK